MTDQDESGRGIVLRSRNGTVIAYDQSGLVMRLSDKVIADIAMRLGDRPQAVAAALPGGETSAAAAITEADLNLVAGLDAWDLRREGDWLSFMAHVSGEQGTRRFRRHTGGGGVIADAPGPFYGLFTLGGARAGLAEQRQNAFPYHVMSADDDIGAVGQGGEGAVVETAHLAGLREQTHEALVAEALLRWQMAKKGTLPLFVVRCENDSSSSAERLVDGRAQDNLMTDIANFVRAGAQLGKRPEIMAIGLDFTLEDVVSNATEWRDHMLSVMTRIESRVAELGLKQPLFIMRLETTGPLTDNAAAVEGQWELAWNHHDHRVLISAPGYMFPVDDLARPTPNSAVEMAEMSAAAIAAGKDWKCPVPHLAERVGDKVRLVFQTAGTLVIDPADPLGAGPGAGLYVDGVENDAVLTSVQIDPDDPEAILLEFDRRPEGQALVVCHACQGAAVSAIRDDWAHQCQTGRTLHRWALPARLTINEGPLAS